MVIEIDGSILEGGGQILRSALAFSAVLGKKVLVNKIRANRKTPGLRPQHLHGILSVQKLTKAQVKGTHEGSNRIEFHPQNRQGGDLSVDIGTAGAITLVLQSVMIVAPYCEQPTIVKLIGGTNVAWSPPIDYLQSVFLPRLSQMGYEGKIETLKRGYYPRGGGQVRAVLTPVRGLIPLDLDQEENQPKITGISHCGRLPRHVAERQANAARNALLEKELPVHEIIIEQIENTHSPGSGISLIAANDESRLIGADALGKRGVKAEIVGENAAKSLLKEIVTKACVDQYQADMLIPYMALADGTSTIFVSKLTMHTVTNIHVVEQFLDIKFNVDGEIDSPARISVTGMGLEGLVTSC